MFIVENGLITGDKTFDIGEIRKIDFIFKFTDTAFDDNDKFQLDLGGNKFSLYGFTDAGCLRFTRCDLTEVITKAESNFSVSVLLNGTAILSDEITITAVVQGGGDIVLPDVTVTADTMLKDVTAINTDGDVVTGNIEDATINVTEDKQGYLVFSVSKGYLDNDYETGIPPTSINIDETNGLNITASTGFLKEDFETSFPASTITTDETNGLTINVSKGYLAQNESENFPASTITETETSVTVSRGFLNEDKSFDFSEKTFLFELTGAGTEAVNGKYYDTGEKATNTQYQGDFVIYMNENKTCKFMVDPQFTRWAFLPPDEEVSKASVWYYCDNGYACYDIEDFNLASLTWMAVNGIKPFPTITLLAPQGGFFFNNAYRTATAVKILPDETFTADITDFYGMFHSCYALTSISALDTSNGTSFSYMFYGCYDLTQIPSLDTSNGINFSYMFYNCYALTSIPSLDTSNGTNFSRMFNDCSALTSIPSLDTSNGTDFNRMFNDCSALTSIPALNTANGTNFGNMFYNCSALTTIEGIDFSGATSSISAAFGNCSALTSVKVNGTIAKNIDFSGAPNLDAASCISIAQALVENTGTLTITFSSTTYDNILLETIMPSTTLNIKGYIVSTKGWTIKTA